MSSLTFADAAELMAACYARTLGDRLEVSIDVAGVQASCLKDGTLLIPGTNEISDWFDFNLHLGGIHPVDGHGFDVVAGDSGALWHGGFLQHAQIVYSFAKGLRPKFIVGHSLGAASAQIVGMSLATPTIAFASPQTCRSRERLVNEGWVVNVCRLDDAVCHAPPSFLGFRTLGSRYWLTPDDPEAGEDHRIQNYQALLKLKRIKDRLPAAWPT